MPALRAALGDRPVAFEGVGGDAMAAQGLRSLFPLQDIAVMGFGAVIARLPSIVRLVYRTVDAIVQGRPGRGRHHRQPRIHARRRQARPPPAAFAADRQLRQPERVGVAAGAGAQDARLCRPRARPEAVRAGGASAARRPALHLCRPSADRAARRAAARAGRAAGHRRRTRSTCSCCPAAAAPRSAA